LYNYHEDGTIASEVQYLNGLANGMAKYYTASGVLQEKGLYKEGMKNGDWFQFQKNGQDVAVEGAYKNDQATGTWYYYSSRGKLINTEIYQ
jgi:antitoxin component YwqK of YwqJK toxin-antitoxin module